MVLAAPVKIAVPQMEPCWLDKAAGVEKTIRIIREAASNEAKLVAFGELWLPGYPSFLYGGSMNDVGDLGVQYYQSAVTVDGPEIKAIQEATKECNIIVHLGFTERAGKSLYMSNVIIDETGKILLHRRKIKPSHYERTLHGDSPASAVMNCVETSIGRISVLNCWEHFQPLLKYHTYTQHPDIHISAWPMLHPWGGVEQWSHCTDSGVGVTRSVACESGAFVLCATNIITTENGMKRNQVGDKAPGHITPGGGFSAVYGPDGRKLSQDIKDDEETMLYAVLDPKLQAFAALVQDTVGHYSRPDIFTLKVNTSAQPRVVYHRE